MAEKKKPAAKPAAKKAAPAKKKAPVKKAAPALKKEKVAAPVVVEQVASAPTPAPVPRPPKPKREKLPVGPRYYGTGRRKEATAKVWLKPGSGRIIVNGRPAMEYFAGRKILEFKINRPFKEAGVGTSFDAFVEALGGGVPSQADATAMGISRALLVVNPEYRSKLKRVGLLKRDPRMKERKKYGLKRARRAFQYSKR